MSSSSGLAALSRPGQAGLSGPVSVPRPQFRWRTRVFLPGTILLSAAAVLAWSARDALWPAMQVHTVPVIVKARPTAGAGDGSPADPAVAPTAAAATEETLVQAPGWIEPDPFAITIPALTDGVVKEVFVLEGQVIEAGQVVARMIDDDAKLSLRRAEAELAERAASVEGAKADLAAAEARAAEVRDEATRKRPLASDGTVSAAQMARLELQLRAVEAAVASARATIAVADAALHTQEVLRDQARLALDRTEIRSPVAGVVLSRSIQPGSRIAMTGPGAAEEAGVARVYNPTKLQVRVDVPLASAAKIGVGTPARIVTETLPDATFSGVVTRVVHEANIQRNTVQFKVAIDNPVSAMKPEMLARVKLLSGGAGRGDGANASAVLPAAVTGSGGQLLLLPENVLIKRSGTSASVWLVAQDSRRGTVATLRSVTLGPWHEDGFVEIVSGAGPTDRAIVGPQHSLTEGARIRVLGEAAAAEGDAK